MTRDHLAVALAIVALTGSALPAAHGAADSRFFGGCGLDAVTQPLSAPEDWNLYHGYVYSAVLVYAPQAVADNPVAATVTCSVLVNGATVDAGTVAGTLAVAGASQISFRALDEDEVDVCTTVDFTSDATPTQTRCGGVLSEVVDSMPVPVDPVLGLLQETSAVSDTVICPILAGLAPGVPGAVDVTPEGDVLVVGEPFWDCPPYGLGGAGAGSAGAGPGDRKVRRKHKDPVEPAAPATPYHPQGTVQISRDVTGIVNYAFSGFVPPFESWTCTTSGSATASSATCTPPPPPPGSVNVCGTVTVAATSTSTGAVTGTSRCASGPVATATSAGPATVPDTATASPNTDFPWTCVASPADSLAWTVRCTVG